MATIEDPKSINEGHAVKRSEIPSVRLEGEPFFLTQKEFEQLEVKLSIVPPPLRVEHKKIEAMVCQEFLKVYGNFLSEEQQSYFRSARIIVSSPESVAEYKRNHDKVDDLDPGISVVEGCYYTSYSIGEEAEEGEDKIEFVNPLGGMGTLIYSGRFPLIAMSKRDAEVDVDQKYLTSQEGFDQMWQNKPIGDQFVAIEPFIFSNEFGLLCLHEKVHGLQDPKIPLPILEAAALYYQRDIFRLNSWEYTKASNMENFADLYEICVQEIGEDLHRFMFENIKTEAEKVRILNRLKEVFNSKKIEEMSKYNEHEWSQDTRRWLYWKKRKTEDKKV